MLGATDEYQQPIQKATALVPNFKWKKTSKRCSGHRGKLHGQLQGKKSGINRTALAAAYPRSMCQHMCHDVISCLNESRQLRLAAWPKSLHHIWHGHFYKCEKCCLGKAAPPGLEHSLLPGECHHGRYPTADGKRPRKNPEAPSSSPINDWKKPARNSPMEDVTLELPQAVSLGPAARVYWKVALFQVIQDALAVFSEATDIGKDYVKHWTMDEPQDLSICSQRQIFEAVDIDAWQITLFDKELGDGGKRSDSVAKSAPRTPAPITPGTVAPSTSMPTRSSSSSTPLPLQPAPATPNNHDPLPDISAEPLPAQPPAEHEQDQPRDDEEPYEIEEFKPRQLTSNKPLYDFKKVFQRLPQLAKEKPDTAARLLLGLHEKYWHAPPSDLRNLLARAGMPVEVLNLVSDAVMKCSICRRYVRLPNRPQTKINNAGTLYQCVQADLLNFPHGGRSHALQDRSGDEQSGIPRTTTETPGALDAILWATSISRHGPGGTIAEPRDSR